MVAGVGLWLCGLVLRALGLCMRFWIGGFGSRVFFVCLGFWFFVFCFGFWALGFCVWPRAFKELVVGIRSDLVGSWGVIVRFFG